MKQNLESKTEINACKRVLEECLSKEEYIPTQKSFSNAKIENIIANYLSKNGYNTWLEFDDISGYVLNNNTIAQKALTNFVKEEKIFYEKSTSTTFKIVEKHTITKNNKINIYFEAEIVKNNNSTKT